MAINILSIEITEQEEIEGEKTDEYKRLTGGYCFLADITLEITPEGDCYNSPDSISTLAEYHKVMVYDDLEVHKKNVSNIELVVSEPNEHGLRPCTFLDKRTGEPFQDNHRFAWAHGLDIIQEVEDKPNTFIFSNFFDDIPITRACIDRLNALKDEGSPIASCNSTWKSQEILKCLEVLARYWN